MTVSFRLDPKRQRGIATALQGCVSRGEVPCAVTAIANREGILFSEAFSGEGMAATTDSIFLLASITKPIVATAVLQLVEDGLLVLSDPINRVIPECRTGSMGEVTAWHLLTHTSGMDEAAYLALLVNGHIRSAADCVVAACRAGLHFAPGTRYEYCSLSFYLLGELIRRLTGMEYPEYLRERIFTPLGMLDTSFDPAPAAERAMPVRNMGAETAFSDEESLASYTRLAMPGGGLWSTAADLVRFGQACQADLLDGTCRLLARPTMAWMTREHTTGVLDVATGQPAHYGLGWGLGVRDGQLPGSPGVFEHGGATGTRLWIDPAYGLVLVFLTNQWGVEGRASYVAVTSAYAALRD